MEAKIALLALLGRNPNLRLAVDPEKLELSTRPGWHEFRELPVAFGLSRASEARGSEARGSGERARTGVV